ncbi:DNA ligase (ATP) [Basidiobolus ranarum]|uniref:DNA ligase n=1 Tax=Basidiobolus ranarum TaxID=34480 RepID=A0ABR2X2F2_9FUNG
MSTIMSSLSTSTSPLFSELCRLFESIAAKSIWDWKRRKMERFTQSWRSRYESFFSVMRLMLPHLDRERASYGMKEKVLARTYIAVLGLDKDSDDANSLLNWRLPGKSHQRTTGDFGDVLYEVLIHRSVVVGKGSLTIDDINDQLDNLNKCVNREEEQAVISHLFRYTTALEQKWIARIILKEFRIGLSERLVFGVYHPDAYKLFNVCSNLRKVCDDLKDPAIRIKSQDLNIFHPFKPMLSKRSAISNIVKLMNNKPFWIEAKLDGERIQLHKRGTEYQYWTRHANDNTALYGPDPFTGSLTPHIHKLFNSKAKNCILDGEMVAYDPLQDALLPFGSLRSASKDESSTHHKIQPCFMVFDIVFCNNTPVIDQPLSERRKLLKNVVEECDGYLHVIDHIEAASTKEICDIMDQAIVERGEGIIVKNPHGIYSPNDRNSNWLKLKPEYVDSLADDLDLLIVGGYYGTGSREGRISRFLCAVLDDTLSLSHEMRFKSFCRVGTGYTSQQIENFNAETKDHWLPYNTQDPPTWLNVASSGREKPDVYIYPTHSKVVQVKGAEVIVSTSYGAGYTLRFPRFVQFRDDKTWKDAMKISELIPLRKEASTLFTRKVSDLSHSQEISKKPSKRRKVPTIFPSSLTGAPSSKMKIQSEIFSNKSFYVMFGDEENDKHELENLVKLHGGNFYQDEGAQDNIVVISGTLKWSVRNLIKRGTHNIFLPSWIRESIQSNSVLPFKKRHFLYATLETEIGFYKDMDRFGDSYTEELTAHTLRDIIDKMDSSNILSCADHLNRQIVQEVEERYFESERLPGGLFRSCICYLDVLTSLNDVSSKMDHSSLTVTEYMLRFYGAEISTCLDSTVTHVLFSDEDPSRIVEISKYITRFERIPELVTTSWVSDSITEKSRLPEQLYRPQRDKGFEEIPNGSTWGLLKLKRSNPLKPA